MRQFSTYFQNATFPVIDYRRRNRYLEGQKTDQLDTCYTAILNYEKIDIVLADDCKAITPQQIKTAADAGTPVELTFHDLEITIKGTKFPWEIQATGRASQAVVASGK